MADRSNKRPLPGPPHHIANLLDRVAELRGVEIDAELCEIPRHGLPYGPIRACAKRVPPADVGVRQLPLEVLPKALRTQPVACRVLPSKGHDRNPPPEGSFTLPRAGTVSIPGLSPPRRKPAGCAGMGLL